jgi:hypothetical protein
MRPRPGIYRRRMRRHLDLRRSAHRLHDLKPFPSEVNRGDSQGAARRRTYAH